MPTDPAAAVPSPAPAALGYRMPPEWAAHQGTWFSWPHNPDTWADHLEAAERALARAVHALGLGETVHLNVLDAAHEDRLRRLLGTAADAYVRYHRIPTNDAWCRDHGPIFVTNPAADAPLAATIWRFNAWGGKYPPTTSTMPPPTAWPKPWASPASAPTWCWKAARSRSTATASS